MADTNTLEDLKTLKELQGRIGRLIAVAGVQHAQGNATATNDLAELAIMFMPRLLGEAVAMAETIAARQMADEVARHMASTDET